MNTDTYLFTQDILALYRDPTTHIPGATRAYHTALRFMIDQRLPCSNCFRFDILGGVCLCKFEIIPRTLPSMEDFYYMWWRPALEPFTSHDTPYDSMPLFHDDATDQRWLANIASANEIAATLIKSILGAHVALDFNPLENGANLI